jgi:hypothetical protein
MRFPSIAPGSINNIIDVLRDLIRSWRSRNSITSTGNARIENLGCSLRNAAVIPGIDGISV